MGADRAGELDFWLGRRGCRWLDDAITVGRFGRDCGPAGAQGAAVSAAGGSRHRDFGDAGGRQRSGAIFRWGRRLKPEALALFGIERAPCHATYHYVFRSLDGDALARALGGFACGRDEPGHIALDGKTLRGSRRLDAKALHVVSAFATQLSAVVGDLAVAPEENEIHGGRSRCSRSCRSRARSSPATRILPPTGSLSNDHRRTRRPYVRGGTTSPR